MHKLFRFVLIYFFYYLYIVDSIAEIPTDYFSNCQESTLDKNLRLILFFPDQVESEGLYYKILNELNKGYGISLKKELGSYFRDVQVIFALYSSYLPKGAEAPVMKFNYETGFFTGNPQSIGPSDFKLARNAHFCGLLPRMDRFAKENYFTSTGGRDSWLNLYVAFVDNVPAYKKHTDTASLVGIPESDYFSLKICSGKLIILSTEKHLTNWAQFLYEEKIEYSSVYPYDVDLVQTIATTSGRYACKTRSTQHALNHLVEIYNHLYPTLFFDEKKFFHEHSVTFVLDAWGSFYTDLGKKYFLKWAENKSYFYLFMSLFLAKIPNSSILFQTLTTLYGFSKLHAKEKQIEMGFNSFAIAKPRGCADIKNPIERIFKKHSSIEKQLKRIVPVFLNHGLYFPSLDSPNRVEDYTPDCHQNAFGKELTDNNALAIYTSRSWRKPGLDLIKICGSILRHNGVYYDLSVVPNYVQYAFDLMRIVEIHLSSIESKYRGALDYLSVDYMKYAQEATLNLLFLLPKSPRALLAPQLFNVFANTIPKTAITPTARSSAETIFGDTQYKISLYSENDYMYTGQDTFQDCSCQLKDNFNQNNQRKAATELHFDFSKQKAEFSSAIPKLYCCLKDKNIAWEPKACKMIVILADSPPVIQNKVHPITTKSILVPSVEDIDRLIVENNIAVTIVSDPKYIHLWKTFLQNIEYRPLVSITPLTPNTLFTTEVSEAIKNYMASCTA